MLTNLATCFQATNALSILDLRHVQQKLQEEEYQRSDENDQEKLNRKSLGLGNELRSESERQKEDRKNITVQVATLAVID